MNIIFNNLLTESGIRNINKLRSLFDEVVIVTHQDLDGVTSAIGMKYYFEKYGFKVIDTQIIQYGDKEFAIKKSDPTKNIMYCLCDFAHGKPMFTVHLDHHDKQVGVEKGSSVSFRQSRSNVETISQIVSPSDIFPDSDIKMISTVDSADFVKMGIKPEDVMTYVFQLDKEKELSRNKKIMALVTNKLLLAYKNKPKFLERLVMESTPSLLNIYLNIVRLAKGEGYVSPDVMKKNLDNYIEAQKTSQNVEYFKDYGIISQYGGGALFKPGAYDRYVPFKNYPEANFLVIAWPLGLLQASCNPFKATRELKGVNLGEIMQEVLGEYESELKAKKITVDTIKYFAEKSKDFGEDSVGFTFNDMIALFSETEGGIVGLNDTPKGSSADYTVERWQSALKKLMDKPYTQLSDRETKALKLLSISGWDMIQANSGGHKCITNASGLMYFGKDGKEYLLKFKDSLVNKLKEKIDENKLGENVKSKKQVLKEVTEFQDIYSSMWDKMLNQVCMKYTKDRNKAEDFCQNGFIKVYKNLGKYDESGSLEGWVRRVINNSILDELRKEKMSFVDKGDDGFDFSRLDVGEEEYEESEFSLEDIKKVLPQLSPAYKKVFELYYLDGLKHEDIAKKLGVSANTSKTNLMKARAKVKEFLTKK
jgi:RNA polymerase sigma factor (sigma-70 family)